MFDEFDNKNAARGNGTEPVSSTPVKTVDIFSQVDKTIKPEALRPRDNDFLSAAETVIPLDDSWLKNKGLIIGLIFGGLIILIGGGFFGFKLINKSTAPININNDNAGVTTEQINNNQITPEVPTSSVEEIKNVIEQPIRPTVDQPIDIDQDGLTDEEEATFSTNPNNPDTDNDGLTDREEVKVYDTDPIKADTDGDGYADGEEVKNGFNPQGSGKLFNINNQ
ncbi:hypothetical protein KKA93_01030 [Patescibacteria group bacterium]|nr:hypothetical protein [Patescibacteria group bacterium]MBU1663566.1 hypothetical protein [Patescibacteria group bacterium]MBU1934196.1 hypothetical protein [Patescibacteria group bacterium]MBU2007590.1 hypothetical protein [Patescibacteria group bacterium]MBU2233802.1 hypothetical protein [Patescibacteria group bacterium]